MKTRLIVHYRDGKTYTGNWNSKYNFDNLNYKDISSLQIQDEYKNKYTLSSKRGTKNKYWSESNKVISIFRNICDNFWIELTLNEDGIKIINILDKHMGHTNA